MSGRLSLRVGGMAILAVVVLLVLRQAKPEWGIPVRLAATLTAMGVILSLAGQVITTLSDLSTSLGTTALDGDSWTLVLRALGLAFLTEVTASVCRDSGEGTLAGWVETAGKLEILLLSFPLIRSLLSFVAEVLS
ncbi:MAG: stage III sporulation AC/AD family protein [Clostridia bacterium]|nr:stage III sporulation AC/AD family protein [Clostridia bacterium]